MIDITDRIGDLSPAKRELLTRRLAQKRQAQAAPQAIPRRTDQTMCPLSFSQERLWFLDRLLPNSSLYTMAGATRMSGPLDEQVVIQSFNAIIRRHAVLRTTFKAVDGQPVAVIAPEMQLTPQQIDLRSIPLDEREAVARRLMQAEVRQPFDLTRGPLIRLMLVRLADEEYIGLLSMHHIVADGWSTKVLFQEFVALYQAQVTGMSDPLPALPIQYADYAAWQRERLQGTLLETQLDYWKQQFGNDVPVLDLPTDYPRPAAPTFQGARQPIRIAAELTRSLQAFSQREGVTLFMTLLAAFKILLGRYTRQSDLVVGIPVAERSRPELAGLIGCFLNMLALRTQQAAQMPFRTFLAHVQNVALGAYAHQDLPFEKLVDELHLDRTLSHAPLCQAAFSFEDNPTASLQIQNLAMHFVEIDTGTAKLDLGLELTQMGGVDQTAYLEGWIEYNTDIFAAATIERMAGHLVTLLTSIAANPDQCLADLALLTEAERQQLLVEWNATATNYPHDVCIHTMIAAQAERTPQAVAVVYGDTHLTYHELNSRANQVAHYLQTLGVVPETLVAVCIERSPLIVIAMLGILKAGGAYVPLDPGYPADRLAMMLADSRASLLLTTRSLDIPLAPQSSGSLPDMGVASDVPRIYLDQWELVADQSVTDPVSTVTANNLAYVIYTSGSTGIPKGVAVAHRELVHHTLAFVAAHNLDPHDRVLLFVSLSFDAAAAVLYPPLVIGATFVIPEIPGAELTGNTLTRFCERQQITVMHLPASFWHQWVDELAAHPAPFTIPLKVILTGGESPAISKLRLWSDLVARPMMTFLNAYGPTEAVITTTLYATRCDPDLLHNLARIPAGRPIANKKVYVLDTHLHPVPIGIPGEVYVGGIGLARGYLHHPELTAARFVPDPFSATPGARLYRTGDLARYLPDGNLEFLGRVDHQVKIRGFRIELGEIETLLARHPQVEEVAVVVRQNPSGNPFLVAYIVLAQRSDGATVSFLDAASTADAPSTADAQRLSLVSALRQFLKASLPDYMLPSAYVFLAALPLTAHGKVDERALPAPDHTRLEGQEFVTPRTPVEHELSAIWAQVLDVPQVGVMDNFFELGGHSLLATQIMSRVRNVLQVDIPLRVLFAEPTIAHLAHHIEQAQQADHISHLPPIQPVVRDGDLPLSFAQQRLWFLNQLEPDSPFYTMPAAVQLDGLLDVDALQHSLNEIAARHETLRTTFRTIDGQTVQRIAPSGAIAMPLVDLTGLDAPDQHAQVQQLIASAARQPFDLECGPLVRTTLIRLNARQHIFVLNMHHIVSDDWSMGQFIREIGILYQAWTTSTPPALPALPIQYADYAVWQRQWLQGDALSAQLGYWKQHLGGSLPVLDLPTDYPRPPVQTYRGARQTFALPPTLSDQLRTYSQQAGVTLFMTMLAAFQTLLYRYTGQPDVIVGSPIAGRNRSETEELIGFFVNTLVLRTDLSGNPPFQTLVQRVRDVTLGAYVHQDVPFEKLVEELQPQRDLSRSPLFQVMFVLHNTPAVSLQLSGVTAALLDVPHETALFDITLSITDTDEGLTGWWEYNRDLFDAATIARMAGHYQTLLTGIAANPDQCLADLPLLTTAEQRHLLELAQPWATPYPRDCCVHELFEFQSVHTPAVPAVCYADEQLCYAELNTRANQLAHYLQSLGVGPEMLVGICVERSLDMIVGLLGILKAGGAYLPLDPAFPPERLAYMLEDSQAGMIVTQAQLLDRFPSSTARVICLDRDWPQIARELTTNPVSGVLPDNLAYVLYTSGSTGRPKGVQITHQALVNFLESMRRQPGLQATDVLLAVTTLSFDIAGLELYLPLLTGARVVLASRDVATDGVRLSQLLHTSGTTVMQATPATWRLLLEAGWSGNPQLKILCGGEAFPRDLANQLLPRCESLWNMYGPTETTIWSTLCQVEPGENQISIGRPIANTQTYILDAYLQPVPLGIPGELYIGGDGLARGYLNRPELTAERFVPNPFTFRSYLQPADHSDPNDNSAAVLTNAQRLPPVLSSRLYRTGDLARYLPDGTLEFLGRIDNQVKIRGFRIEIGEIEAVLARHPTVHQNVVVARNVGTMNAEMLTLIAYVVPNPELTPSVNEWRRFLKEHLPEYMVPSIFVTLEAFPLTPNGKIDRRALPLPDGLRPELEASYVSPRSELEHTIATIWQEVLHLDQVGIHDNFFDLGGHSLLMAQVHTRLRNALPREIAMLDLFKYPTISALIRYVQPDEAESTQNPATDRDLVRPTLDQHTPPDIAIIGMSGRFPGARTIESFWANLCAGTESITFFTAAELLAAGVDPQLVQHPQYVPANAILDDIAEFDAGLFKMTPREAEITDPQHRLLLECAWEALERAGYDPDRYAGRIGVYAGVSLNTYLLNNLASNWHELLYDVGFHPLFVGNDKDFAPTRIAYKLNLRGPAVAIQTACSTSLVAVHAACQSLRDGECDMALAGGAMVKVPQQEGYLYHEGGIASPDGHCRAFDAAANGTVRGDGVGIVVLKRLADAQTDGDTIYAVIKGSAINNDGANKVGYTAPGVDGQAAVISAALNMAAVDPTTISYIEAHGTGTSLGDPIEVAALTQAFRTHTTRTGFCALGSVKTNIGHLDTAAGVAGLIKTVLALHHQQLPPSLHVTRVNPQIAFESTPFTVQTHLSPWPASDHPRRAGVSSFGIGGTNAHVVLEEAPPPPPSGPTRPWQLLLLSAQTPTALETMSDQLGAYLQSYPTLPLADVAFTLHVGRQQLAHRRMLVCQDSADATAALSTRDPARVLSGTIPTRPSSVVFLFPGQGAQYPQMAHDLYLTEPVFRAHVDACVERLQPHLDLDLRDLLYADPPLPASDARLTQTCYAQPALFVIEYALAHLWMAWGIQPEVMIGHSIGEYVAACLAGVLTLDDALALVAARGRLMQQVAPGAMLAVPLTEAAVQPLLVAGLDLAAVNGPSLCVLAGPEAAIVSLEQQLRTQGVDGRRLHTSHAFHSAMMDPILDKFAAQVAQVPLRPPQRPYVSNVTGRLMTAADATDPHYWVRHLRSTVRFAAGVQTILSGPASIFLEVGPGQTLTGLVRQHLTGRSDTLALPSLRHPHQNQSDVAFALTTLGRLWLAGVPVNASAYYAAEQRRRVLLPTYPFERQRYWIAPRTEPSSAVMDKRPEPPAPVMGKRPDMADWGYLPIWKPLITAEPFDLDHLRTQPATWLLFADSCGVATHLADRLRTVNQCVIMVQRGTDYQMIDAHTYRIVPGQAEHYSALLDDLERSGQSIQIIVHLWSVTPGLAEDAPGTSNGTVPHADDLAQETGLFSLIALAQALGARAAAPLHLGVVSSQMHTIAGGISACPHKATLLGPCLVIPQEYPHITCHSIDIDRPEPAAPHPDLIETLITLLVQQRTVPVIAYRGHECLVQTFEPVRLDASDAPLRCLRPNGVYLITGGLGGIGLTLADYLARTVQARLVLTARSVVPDRSAWATWLADHDPQDATSQLIQQIQALEHAGADVLVLAADVADQSQMQQVIATILARFGTLHGVIHAAGVLDNAPIAEKTPAAVARVLRPKVQGTLVLHTVLHDLPLDWMVLCSSLTSALGGMHAVDYTAANAFLDAFAHSQAARTGHRVTVINWDTWHTVGMAAHADATPAMQHWLAEEREHGIAPSEGVELFNRIIQRRLRQVLVSPRELQLRIERSMALVTRSAATTATQSAASAHPRPALATPYVAPRTELEQTVARICQTVLGIEQVGIHDNLFELGCDSLLAIQFMAHLKQELDVQLSPVMLFEAPTISALVEHIQPTPVAVAVPVREEGESRAETRRALARQRQTRPRSTNSER